MVAHYLSVRWDLLDGMASRMFGEGAARRVDGRAVLWHAHCTWGRLQRWTANGQTEELDFTHPSGALSFLFPPLSLSLCCCGLLTHILQPLLVCPLHLHSNNFHMYVCTQKNIYKLYDSYCLAHAHRFMLGQTVSELLNSCSLSLSPDFNQLSVLPLPQVTWPDLTLFQPKGPSSAICQAAMTLIWPLGDLGPRIYCWRWPWGTGAPEEERKRTGEFIGVPFGAALSFTD